jgi:ubiquinone/menaquinone biosynthesis C-methylase UbiE
MNIDHFGFLAPFYERFITPIIPEKIIGFVNLPADGIVLDAAGGTGRVAQFFRNKAARVLVADESFLMLKEAHAKEGLHPVCSHIENTPFGYNYFDGIIMVDAFHHVADQSGTIQELWRILKPGGRIVIEEPDIRFFRVKLIAFAEKVALMRSHFISPPDIAKIFNFLNAQVRVEVDGSTAWIIAEKQSAG